MMLEMALQIPRLNGLASVVDRCLLLPLRHQNRRRHRRHNCRRQHLWRTIVTIFIVVAIAVIISVPSSSSSPASSSPFRSILFHLEGQVPLADNNGPLSACFYVMCRQAAPRKSRAMHPQTIEHLRPTLWQAPSQTVRRSQAARRRLRRRALIFRLGARAALVGHLDSRSTELSSTSSHLENF